MVAHCTDIAGAGILGQLHPVRLYRRARSHVIPQVFQHGGLESTSAIMARTCEGVLFRERSIGWARMWVKLLACLLSGRALAGRRPRMRTGGHGSSQAEPGRARQSQAESQAAPGGARRSQTEPDSQAAR